MKTVIRYAAAGALTLGGHGVFAETHGQMPEQCEVRSEEPFISVLLCAPGLDQQTLSLAGKMACGDRLPCGAWIWSDQGQIPIIAPKEHGDLTQAQVTSAVGVWVAEQAILVQIEKAEK